MVFDTNGGSEIEAVEINAGEKAIAPTEPTKEGYTFAGWYVDKELTIPFDFDTLLQDGNYKLFAKWAIGVHYETNGGTTIKTALKEEGDTIILPTPSKEGKFFEGWYLDSEYQNKAEALFTVPSENVTLYAKWSGIEEGTVISFVDYIVSAEKEKYDLSYNEENHLVITPTEKKTGWAYLYAPIQYDISDYQIVRVAFIGKSTNPESKLTVKLEGGNATAAEQHYAFTGELQEIEWVVPSTAISTVSGEKILLFVEGALGSGNPNNCSVELIKLEICKVSSNTEIQGLFFNTNGGTFIKGIFANEGEVITAPTTPQKAGFSFDGWYEDFALTIPFEFTTMPKGPTTIYAKWTENNICTLTYVTNCETTLPSQQFTIGSNVTYGKLENGEYTLIGWYTDEELTKPFDGIMPGVDTTIYAKWVKLSEVVDRVNPVDLLKGWVVLDLGTYVYTEIENSILLTATTTKGKWSCLTNDFTADLSNILAIHIKYKNGTVNDKFMFKLQGDNVAIEYTIEITAESNDVYILVDKNLEKVNKAVLFYAPNEELTANKSIEFEAIELLNPFDADAKEGYTLLDLNLSVGYYASGEDDAIHTTQKVYAASDRRYTKEDLPVGTILVLNEGYAYRADGWNTETGKSTAARPVAVTTAGEVVIDEAWWGVYIYRSFHVYKPGVSDVTDMISELSEAFKVYVPKK